MKDDKPVQTELYLGKFDAAQKMVPVKVLPDGLVYEVNETGINAVKTERANFLKA